jgi:Uma2 family endonuclease
MPDTVIQMSRENFRRWEDSQQRRYERVAGQVVPMPAEQVAHVELKGAIWVALRDAIRAAELPCQAFVDGLTVEVGEDSDFRPDALVNAGPRPAPNAVVAPNPIIVVEVLSPSTQSADRGRKLSGYFRVPSIQHYLVVSASRRQVVHHRRAGNDIVSVVATEGVISLDPPGIAIAMDEIYRDIAF